MEPALQGSVQTALERIRALDQTVRAWVEVHPRTSLGTGPLAGVPYGAKDIIETAGMATEYGSPLYQGRIGSADAAIIRELTSRGAVLLGKTHTAAFAYRDPAPTRNPRNPDHTPGGSSSGSAAAVACGMAPFAIGTQTLGSVVRPASYCGVTGFKPTYGWCSMDGVLPCGPSLDTLGFFTQTPEEMLVLWRALGRNAGPEGPFAMAVLDPLPRFVEPQMAAEFQRVVGDLRRAGLDLEPINLSESLSRLADAALTVMFYEGARVHRERYQLHGDGLGQLAGLVREGLAMPESQYKEACRLIDQGRESIRGQFEATPVILSPAATGAAPLGLSYTGDARMNSPWTALGTPALSIPMPIGQGLPLGLQLTAAPGEDSQALLAGREIHRILSSSEPRSSC